MSDDSSKPDASKQSIPSSVNSDATPVSSDDWPKAWDEIHYQFDAFGSLGDSHRVYLDTLYIDEGDDEWWPLKEYIRAIASGEIE